MIETWNHKQKIHDMDNKLQGLVVGKKSLVVVMAKMLVVMEELVVPTKWATEADNNP